MRIIKRIVIHCSDSWVGDAELIDRWHKARTYRNYKGEIKHWSGIGYHKVILNGKRKPHSKYIKRFDGLIEDGRKDERQGAHVAGENRDTLGVCLIGRTSFTQKQMFVSLPVLLGQWMTKYNISVDNVLGHYELDSGKTCPNWDMPIYRDFLRGIPWAEYLNMEVE